MILLDRKKPISALKLIHSLNHTQTNNFCDININHDNLIKNLNYTLNERIYNLHAGLYRISINNIEYIIDVYFDLSNGDFLVIKNENDIKLYMAGSTVYYITPYRINSVQNISSSHYVDSINNNIDIITVTGETDFIGTPNLDNPAKINRITSFNIKTNLAENSDELTVSLKHTLGKLPNGAKDMIIVNADKFIAHDIINTSKEVLSGGLNWEYKESYSDTEYYVFFAKYKNVKFNNTANSIRCSHFESISCDDLLDKNTRKNCIATSYSDYENGIWIKIASSVLDIHGDKDFGKEMGKWIMTQAVSNNPIYIEYEITNTIYNTILIDKYRVKTWYPNTTITLNNNYEFSVFYKAIKPL